MRKLFIPVFVASLAISGAAIAQSSNSSPPAQSGTAQSGQLANAQRVKQDLEKAGFSDVRIVAESFVVQAKSKDGDPILMTIGPRGFTLFEVSRGSNPSSTGSTANSTASNAGATSGSTQK